MCKLQKRWGVNNCHYFKKNVKYSVYRILRGKRENHYNTGIGVFENLMTKDSNSINSGPVFRSVLEESEKKFSNPMYGQDD